VIELRSAKGRIESLQRLAMELVALKPALIVSVGRQAMQAALGVDPATGTADLADALAATARKLRLVTHDIAASTPKAIDAAFATAQRLRISGVNVLGSPFLNAHRMRIIDLAAKKRLPAIYQWRGSGQEGGLIGHGPNLAAMYQLLAGMVVRVLGGSKPGDLPIVPPTRFELAINLRVARPSGLSVPQSLLLRADEVIA